VTVLLQSATLPDGSSADVRIDDGIVTSVVASGSGDAGGEEVVDLAGWLVLAAPAEPHAHLDKALVGSLGRPSGDLEASVAAWTEHSATLSEADVVRRALAALDILVGNGTTAVRTHVNPTSGVDPLVALRAMVTVRDQVRGVADLQIVVLARPGGDDDAVRDALAAGADLVGGAPHSASDPTAEMHRLLRLAKEAGVGVDLHTDEQLDPSLSGLADLAAKVCDGEFPHAVTASHCVALGTQPRSVQAIVAQAVAAAGIGVVTCPMTNLGLQARGLACAPPRGLTALRALLDAGALVAGGGDNLRDPFNPVGRGDALEVASLLVTAGHLTPVEAYDAVSSRARAVMGLPAAGPRTGAVADLLALRADSVGDAVAAAPADRMVWRAGRLVACSRLERRTVLAGQTMVGDQRDSRRSENPRAVRLPDSELSASSASAPSILPGLSSP
jgi:cytosine deaminase